MASAPPPGDPGPGDPRLLADRSTPPRPLLFVIADTGGGHRAAARAVTAALDEAYPGAFEPVLCDPLGGPGSSRLLRWVTGLYGPSIRLAPWTWGAVYYASDSRPMMSFLRSTILTLAHRPLAEAVRDVAPSAIVTFHPLVGKAAVKGRRFAPQGAPVVTVITDLITMHTAWGYDKADMFVVPSAAVRWSCHLAGLAVDRCHDVGLPVGPSFAGGPLRMTERLALRRSLGLSGHRFLVVATGGGEGSGGLAKRAAALLDSFDDVEVVAICGRNRRLEAKLRRLAAQRGGDRLVVKGFVDNMADWLRAADAVVSKAGPGTIAEATCCGASLLLTSHVPGQERGNTEFVVRAGAGRHVPGVAELIAEVDRLRRDPAAVDAMRAAATRLGRPHAAADLADLLARLLGAAPDARPARPGEASISR